MCAVDATLGINGAIVGSTSGLRAAMSSMYSAVSNGCGTSVFMDQPIKLATPSIQQYLRLARAKQFAMSSRRLGSSLTQGAVRVELEPTRRFEPGHVSPPTGLSPGEFDPTLALYPELGLDDFTRTDNIASAEH